MSRDEAYALLTEYTKGEGLIKHALAVEAAMRAYAVRYYGDPDEWGLVGLLHDFDYEQYPDPKDHPMRGAEILRAKKFPEHLIRAILSHAEYLNIGRDTPMEKCLFAVDELCGFIIAVALVRPNKTLSEVTVKSVKKKMKDKSFAKQVNRNDIIDGTGDLNTPLEEHIESTIEALQGIAETLGL